MKELIPIFVMCIPIVAIIMNGIIKLEKVKLEAAKLRTAGEPEMEELRGEVHQLRQEMGEIQERLDFTERLLASQKERAKLGPAEQ